MKGAAYRRIRAQGSTFQIRNASGGGGGRETPSYSDDGEIEGLLEQRGVPRRVTDSSGAEVYSELEIRCIPDGHTLRGVNYDGFQTKLVHPNGQEFKILSKFPEDSGVTVLTVVRD